MKSILLAGAAILAFGTGVTGIAIAQDMPASAQPPATDAPPPPGQGATPATPASPAEPGTAPATPATPAAPPPAADPNAGQPTGAVPPNTGMQPAPAGVPRDPSAPVGTSANPATVGGNMTPPPTEQKEYPLCSKTVQDSCINRGEARKSARKHR
ncbi:Fe-S oxidoreductase [Sphingobium sp. JS3065]|uniref:Fe-S oxidoreductase n=1 Tax=Sphingobium sp. JS3065 TaxID=2970925 RepID=UPI0022644F79|nr:Fe-S oxidoreductase [Sphingobium sp. JS3065]UZW56465.1 Fe-S oxidoreductase [Sphingobium sp. JS3065]